MTAEVLHLSALLATAGACCAVGGRQYRRVSEVVTAVVMVAAMAHIVLGWTFVAPVVWTAILLAFAMSEAAVYRIRSERGGGERAGAGMMAVHSPVGAILMAAMIVGGSAQATEAPAHAHAHAASMAALILLGVLAYTMLTAWTGWMMRASRWRLAQVVSMGGSTLLMSGGMIA